MTTSVSAPNPLKLVNTQHTMLHHDHIKSHPDGFSDTAPLITPSDPRWLFATRVQLVFNSANRIRSIGQLEDLIECGRGMGFAGMHARAIVGIVKEAQLRNGLDDIAMDELLKVPLPIDASEPSDRARWIIFGVLFTWSLMIAGLMQLV